MTTTQDHKNSRQMIYCVKCRTQTDSTEVTAVTMKNGRAATQAICVDCQTKKFRIGTLPTAC